MNSKPWHWIPSFYFIEGAPYALVVTSSLLLYTNMGLSNALTTFIASSFVLPWVIKPLWSPLVERLKYSNKRLVLLQFILATFSFLLACALLTPKTVFLVISVLAFLLMAFSSASNDMVIDSWYLDHLDKKNQNIFIGVRTFFYQIGRLTFIGPLLILVGVLNHYVPITLAWQITLLLTGSILLALAFYHRVLIRKGCFEPISRPQHHAPYISLKALAIAFWQRPHAIFFTLFIVLFNLPEAQLQKVVPLYLLSPLSQGGLALSKAEVGMYFGIGGVLAISLGAVCSGPLINRFGLAKLFPGLSALMLVANGLYLLLGTTIITSAKEVGLILIITQFCYGLLNGAYMVALLEICQDKFYSLSFYAIGTALMSAGMMLPGLVSGYIEQVLGYQAFFYWILLCSLATLILTVLFNRKVIC